MTTPQGPSAAHSQARVLAISLATALHHSEVLRALIEESDDEDFIPPVNMLHDDRADLTVEVPQREGHQAFAPWGRTQLHLPISPETRALFNRLREAVKADAIAEAQRLEALFIQLSNPFPAQQADVGDEVQP